jgi:uncharacterized protein with gpF-like domain
MNTFDKMASFAKKKFPKANSVTHLAKIREEVDEAISSFIRASGQVDLEELADIQLALYAAASKAGFKEGDLKSAAEKKLKVLRKRKWEWKDNQYKHVK